MTFRIRRRLCKKQCPRIKLSSKNFQKDLEKTERET